VDYYLTALKKYAVFNGRARRKEYWYFVLFNFLISLVLRIIDDLLGLTGEGSGLGLLGGLYSLAVFIPGIAVGVRRLHDTGRSGWCLLVALVPIVGVILLIISLAEGSEPGPNKYDS
jgi:uncharacterized membrane protein YhaH (DUF805 family)